MVLKTAVVLCFIFTIASALPQDKIVPEEEFTPEVEAFLEEFSSYGAKDVDPTPGYEGEGHVIDDPSDANPGSGQGGEGTDNSDGYNKVVGPGKTSNLDGSHVKGPGYTDKDTITDEDGHYYLGPSRRRVGDGFGRRRRAPAPPGPPPAPAKEDDEEKALDDLNPGPSPTPAPENPMVKELMKDAGTPSPTPPPSVPEVLKPEAEQEKDEEEKKVEEKVEAPPPPTPAPTATPTPAPTPAPTAFTLLLRVTTGKEDYADSNMKVKMKISGSNGDYTGYFHGGHKGQVKLSTLHPKKGGHEYDFGEIKKAEISSNSGNGWYFTKFEVKSGSRPWTQLGCTDQWLDGKIDDTPYGGSGLYGTHIDLHPVDHHCAAKVPDDWGTKTKTGCFCKNHGKSGKCAKHGSSYTWCRTMNNCKGHSSGGGNWDKCTPGPKDQ